MAQLTFIVTVEFDEDESPSPETIQEVLTKMEDITNQYNWDLFDSEAAVEDY